MIDDLDYESVPLKRVGTATIGNIEMTNELTGIKLADERTPEWHAGRLSGIGASESAAALGLSRYEDSLALWYRKVVGRLHQDGASVDEIARDLEVSRDYVAGVVDGQDQNDLMWFGSEVEPLIAAGLERFGGERVLRHPLGLFRHPEHPWFRASPDCLLAGDRRLGELKSLDPHFARQLGVGRQSEEDGRLPAQCIEYATQGMHQMGVMGAQSVVFGVLVGRRVRCYTMERDHGIVGTITRRLGEFWERILDRRPPGPDYCHGHAVELQQDLFQQVADTRIQASEAAVEWAARRREIREATKALSAEDEELKARLLAECRSHRALVLPDGKELRRIEIGESQVSYTRKAHVQLRECKHDGGPAEPASEVQESNDRRFDEAHRRLVGRGYVRYEVSESGSMYYIAEKGSCRVRVSDHEPNQATRQWMADNRVESIRVDRPDEMKTLLETL